MRNTDEDTIIIPAKSGRLGFFGIICLMMGILMTWFALNMLDPNWEASSRKLSSFEDFPPKLRSTIFLSISALFFLSSLHALRLATSGTIAVFSDKGARVLSATGWHEVAWAEITRIDVRSGKRPSVALRKGEPTWIKRVWPMLDARISLEMIDLPKGALLAELSRRRPDLLPSEIYQKAWLGQLLPKQRASKEPAPKVELDSSTWTG